MFSTNKNIKEANETIAQLQGELASANKTIEDLKKSPFDVEALKKEHAAKIEALTKEHAEKISSLEKEKTEIKASVQKEVASKVTALGIPEAESFKAPIKAATTFDSVMAKLQSMPRGSKERIDFYNNNKKVITQPSINGSTINE